MKKNLVIQLLCIAFCCFVSCLPLAAQFSSGAIQLTEAKIVDRAWHLSSKKDGNPLVRASGNVLFADNNSINAASTFMIDDGPNDNKWWTADVRWFHLKSLSTGQYLTVPGNVPGLALTLTPLIEGEVIASQQFRLVPTIEEGWYKLRSRMGDLVIEINENGQLIIDSPKLDPSANQKFAFNLALPGSSPYAIISNSNRHFFSDNGILSEGTPAVHIKNANASIVWQFQPAGSGYYRIYNTLTKMYLALPPGGGNGSELIMTTSTGTNSHWELKRNNTTFFIAHRSNTSLIINMNNHPGSGNPLYCTIGGVVSREWFITPLPGEPTPAPGSFDRIRDGALEVSCAPIYGPIFKKGLIERVGLNPEYTEPYFAFIREAIAAEAGAGKVDEMLIRFDLNNPGHRVDLTVMVRKYITEVLPLIPRGNWSPEANQAVSEYEEKVRGVRVDYAERVVAAWAAYEAEFGAETQGFSQLIANVDAAGFVWPEIYPLQGTQVNLIGEYTRAANFFEYRNASVIGSSFVGVSVILAATNVYNAAAINTYLLNLVIADVISYTVKTSIYILTVNTSTPVAVAVFAATAIAVKAIEVAELEAFIADMDILVTEASTPVSLNGIMVGLNLVDRLRILSDLDYLMGAPVANGFQFNDDDNVYTPPFTVNCNATVTLSLDETGTTTLTPAMCASVSFQNCGTPIQYFLSKSQFDCDDLGADNPVAYAALTTVDGIPAPYVQRCTLTVNVVDEILPTITCPGNQTLTLGGNNCSAILPDYTALATNVADNCGGVTVSQSPEAGTVVSGGGDMTVTLRVHPLNGVTVTCTFIVTKIDNTPPLVVCPLPQTLVLSSDCTATIPDYSLLTTIYDACGVGSLTQLAPPGSTVSGTGEITALMILTDVNNNTSQCSFTITKVDNTPPTITCPATQTLVLGANCTAALPDYTNLAATADNCGVQGVTQSPAAGTIVANSGNMTVTLTVKDINGNSTLCSFMVTKLDNTPPTVQCFPQTLTFNGETEFILNVDDLVDASDNCGVASISISPTVITCAQIGQTIPVTATVADINGNTSTCVSQVTVTGLPCGWSQNPDGVNCANGSNNTYNPANGVWTATSTNCYSSNFSSDAAAFAQRTLCGDGSVTAQVTSVSGAMGWAGIVMRESNAADAKKAQLITNLSSLNRQEFRTTTGGQAMPQQVASQNRFWLRIVRAGNQFSMYVSPNGQSWVFIGAQNIAMSACIQVGLVATNATANSTLTATFANVSFGGGGSNLATPTDGVVRANNYLPQPLPQPDFSVFPNPTTGEITVNLSAYENRPVRLEVYDLMGKMLQVLETETMNITLDLSAFQNGVYLIRGQSEGLPDATKRVIVQGKDR